MPSGIFHITVNAQQTICISGRIDLSNVANACSLAKNFIGSVSAVRFDLSGIDYADSSSLAMLVECVRSAKMQHKNIVFCNLPQFMLDLGRVCGLDTVLPINKPLQFH